MAHTEGGTGGPKGRGILSPRPIRIVNGLKGVVFSGGLGQLEQEHIPCVYSTLENTFFCPQNSLNWSGHGLYNVSKAFHRDAGPC